MGENITSSDIDIPLTIINIYGPCHNREIYWENLLQADFMQFENLIIGGDLNFSLGLAESWGHRAQTDSLSGFFEGLLDDHNLLNIDSERIMLMWRNRRTRVDALARRLDRFLIRAPLLDLMDCICEWVGSGGYSDHSPLYLEIKDSNHKPHSPFNFNATWLTEVDLHEIVKDNWREI